LAVARAQRWPFRWLNAKPLVYLGTISYTVYLSHHVILLLQRRTQIAAYQISQIARVLFPKRFIQVIPRLELSLHFGRSRRAFAIKRAARREPHQEKRQEADDQQQRHHAQYSAEVIHPAAKDDFPKTALSRA
jgi:peptidoglycan/LPS O-acetylase OafA/YrhL